MIISLNVIHRHRVKCHRVKRHRVKRPRVKRQPVKNTPKGKTTLNHKVRQTGKFHVVYFFKLFRINLTPFVSLLNSNTIITKSLTPSSPQALVSIMDETKVFSYLLFLFISQHLLCNQINLSTAWRQIWIKYSSKMKLKCKFA